MQPLAKLQSHKRLTGVLKMRQSAYGNTQEYAAKLEQTAPQGCDLVVGDIVTFINDYGIPFPGCEVIGFDTTDHNLMKYGNFVHIDSDAYWFPHKPSVLIKESKEQGQARLQEWIKNNPDKVSR